jgi:hypothetical protein
VFRGAAPPAGTHAVHSILLPERDERQSGAARDLKVSLRDVLQDLLLHRQIRHRPPQLRVLLLQILQLLGLFQLQASVFFPPTVEGLSGNRRSQAGEKLNCLYPKIFSTGWIPWIRE